MIGVRPEPQTHDPRPRDAYPIAADAENERTQASANFSVTWIHDAASPDAPSLRDRDGGGVPDSIEALLAGFESARALLVNELGYRPPPQSNPYRLYVADLDRTAYVRDVPSAGISRASFGLIPSTQLRSAVEPREMRILGTHEFFHAIQHGYNANAPLWLMEATSTWAEDVVDDTLNANHVSIRDFAQYPRTSLYESDGAYEYGAFLFIQFLVERYAQGDPAIVKELWTEMAPVEIGGGEKEGIEAIDAVLARRGVTFPRAWAEFLLWRWDLTRFEEGEAYATAAGKEWPRAFRTTEVRSESCALSSDTSAGGLPPLSGDYATFRPADRPDSGRATITVEGPARSTGFVLVLREDRSTTAKFLDLPETGATAVGIRFGDEQVRRVVVGLGNAAPFGDVTKIGYSLRIWGRPAVATELVSPPSQTTFGGQAILRGRVICDGKPMPSADVVLVERTVTGAETTSSQVTGADGTWIDGFHPEQTSTYQVGVVDPLLSPATSSLWTIAVQVRINIAVERDTLFSGDPVQVYGAVSPPHPGAGVLVEYRRPELSWRSGPQTVVAQDGSYRGTFTLPGQGIWQVRASMLSTNDQDHLPATTTQSVFVNVR